MQNLKTGLVMTVAMGLFMSCQAAEAPAQAGENDSSTAQAGDAPDTQTAAQPAAASPNCSDAEYRQLDFWVGEWDLSWQTGNGGTGQGTNSITKSPYGDCVIMENFDGAPTMAFKGMSVSTYFKPAGLWRQAWVDDQGGFFSLYGGPQEDGTFQLDLERVNDTGPYRRMVWTDITENSLTWHWQGKSNAEDDWSELWVINYVRQDAD